MMIRPYTVGIKHLEKVLAAGLLIHAVLAGVKALATETTIAIASSTTGCVIQHVEPKSAADSSGLKNGDKILMANGQSVLNSSDLQRIVQATPTNLSLTLLRGEKREDLIIPLPIVLNRGYRLGVICLGPNETSPEAQTLNLKMGHRRSLTLYAGGAFPLSKLDVTPFGAGHETVGSASYSVGGRFLNDFSRYVDIGIDASYTNLSDHNFTMQSPNTDVIHETGSGPDVYNAHLAMNSIVPLVVVKIHSDGPQRISPYLIFGLGAYLSRFSWSVDPGPGKLWLGNTSERRSLVDITEFGMAGELGSGIDIALGPSLFCGMEARAQFLRYGKYDSAPFGQALGIGTISGSQLNINLLAHLGVKFGSN